jgi:HAD superfamily hydrolase (TIGR01509 family)
VQGRYADPAFQHSAVKLVQRACLPEKVGDAPVDRRRWHRQAPAQQVSQIPASGTVPSRKDPRVTGRRGRDELIVAPVQQLDQVQQGGIGIFSHVGRATIRHGARSGPMLRAAIFDIDGTLIDSNDLHAAAWREVFQLYGVDISHDRVRAQIGKGGDNLMPALLPGDLVASHGEEIEQRRGELFERDYLPRVVPFPGVRELFAALKKGGTRVVLASSAKEREVAHYRQLLGIGDLIDGTTSADEVEHSKPCPDIFAAALDKLSGIGPEEAIVIGDTPYDAEAAGKLGVRSVGVLCGGFDGVVLREAGAVALYDGPWSLPHDVHAWLPQPD